MVNHHAYSMARASAARIAAADRARSSSFGPPAPRVSDEARSEAEAILADSPSRIVRDAALSVIAAHTTRTAPPAAAVRICIEHLRSQREQNRYGK